MIKIIASKIDLPIGEFQIPNKSIVVIGPSTREEFVKQERNAGRNLLPNSLELKYYFAEISSI